MGRKSLLAIIGASGKSEGTVQVELSFMIGAPSPRYKGNPLSEFREILFLNAISALFLVKHGILCGMRPWSASGGRGELSHDALDDRYEGGAKPSARWAVRFSSVVPQLLVSTLRVRLPPRALPR